MKETTEKPTVQSYTTAQLCEIVGITPPRVHQLRTGQTIKIKKANKEYTYPPTLLENVHWMWKDTEVLFFPNSVELLLSIKKSKKSSIKPLVDTQETKTENEDQTNSNSVAQ